MHKGRFYPKLLISFCLWDPQMVYVRQMAEKYFLRRTIGFFDPSDLVPTYNNTQSDEGNYTFGQSVARWRFDFPNRHGHALHAIMELGNEVGSNQIRGGRLLHFIDNVQCWHGNLRPLLNAWDHAFVNTSSPDTPTWYGPAAGIGSIVDPVGW